jgi:rhomboid protease GluP
MERENRFAEKMLSKSDAELQDYLVNKQRYEMEAIEAAISELTRRDKKPTIAELESINHEIKHREEIKEKEEIENVEVTKSFEHKPFYHIFNPLEINSFTPIIIYINVIVFIFMLFDGANIFLPSNEILLRWGADFRPYTLENGSWRLLTNCFVHIGIIHLFMNMYALLFIGLLLEPILGRINFLLAYLLSGLSASAVCLLYHPATISAGASGAIFGIYGVFLSLLLTKLIEKKRRDVLLMSVGMFVIYNLYNGVKTRVIDQSAHVGGLASGIIFGIFFIFILRNPQSKALRMSFLSLMIILSISFCGFVYYTSPNDLGIYQKKMKQFSMLESSALSVLRPAQVQSRDSMIVALHNIGIPDWHSAIGTLRSIDSLHVPAILLQRNQLLIRYCNNRVSCYQTIERSLREKTNMYDNQLKLYNEELKMISSEMGAYNMPEN